MKKEIFAKKKFGQNFLNDDNILNKIVSIVDLKNENVLEIGPGRGALTRKILQDAKSLTSYEIDRDLVDILKKEFNQKNFKLVEGDFLNEDISNYKDTWIIANIPYYITTDILFKILENISSFKGAILMVQKEVAERIVAQKNSQDYSKLSITLQYYATVKKEFIVPSKCFNPAPNVDSAIISLKFDKNKKWDITLNEFFKLCFLQRRKKLSYSLKTKFKIEKIKSVFETLGFDESIRIQQLSLEDILKLFNKLYI
ncbi:16S rRNA (adenine(1518)-N(6)/adenine(1519)-N(6))-dimethyltransferase RsmA [Mycoplasma crocodyli]|uniref:Ribosomal RNA small subunit methyltransferase A n=1 Tax=Mycoplasma crocodyli (strain ATCC 51981 / MP145) TaxID=512564 RepID=D5E4K0_MYCCM|nr:16S rRNA (adenine(1518)-N(6)/adenine(1519)-N(6))-dimethyltransferase RsmA [Mycoplasma crocodyli]ADE19999.1 dimethyladenosine transferase [Mycoplasma crocodyli MP145]